MASSMRVAGTCYIKCDGTQLEVSGSVEVPLNTTVRETVVSTQGVVGYKETERAHYVKLDAVFTSDFPIDAITNNESMTITAELANGMVYVLGKAWLEGEANVNVSDGTITLEFHGKEGGFN